MVRPVPTSPLAVLRQESRGVEKVISVLIFKRRQLEETLETPGHGLFVTEKSMCEKSLKDLQDMARAM